MAQYTRASRRTSVAWTPGETGNPTSIKTFKTFNHTMSPEKSIAVQNGNLIGEFQADPPRPGGRFMEFGFSTEVRGSDTADVPPPEMSLLRACGFSEAGSGSTPAIVYSYVHDDLHLTSDTPAGDVEPIDITLNIDLLNRVVKNCVGNARFNFIAGQLATIDWTFRGLVASGADGATEASASAFDANSAPVPVQNEGWTLNSVDPAAASTVWAIPSFSYDCGNIIDERADMTGEFGFTQPYIVGREPVINITVESTLIATINWEQLYTARTEIDGTFTHNSGGGTRQQLAVTFSGILAEYPVLADLNGKMVYNLVLNQSIETGADKLTLAWT